MEVEAASGATDALTEKLQATLDDATEKEDVKPEEAVRLYREVIFSGGRFSLRWMCVSHVKAPNDAWKVKETALRKLSSIYVSKRYVCLVWGDVK
jgi:hypothetical protein